MTEWLEWHRRTYCQAKGHKHGDEEEMACLVAHLALVQATPGGRSA